MVKNSPQELKNILSLFTGGLVSVVLATQIYGADNADDLKFRVCRQPINQPLVKDFGDAHGKRLSLIRMEASKWINGTRLFYHFLPDDGEGYNDQQKNAVRNAFQTWKDLGIGLSFQESPDAQRAQIKIGFDYTDGSWSYVGRDSLAYAKDNAKSMNFGWDLTTPYGRITALHEIGHALGFPHEHQNPLSGIEWNKPVVYKYFQGPPNNWNISQIDHNIISQIPKDAVRGSKWDPDSVMHYSFKAGLIKVPERYMKEDLVPPLKLSKQDKEMIRKFYPALSVSDRYPALKPFISSLIELNPGGQSDFYIKVNQNRLYTIQTFGLLDSVMVLFDAQDMSVIKGNDSSGSNENSKIEANLQQDKDYILRLRLHYTNEDHGSVMLF